METNDGRLYEVVTKLQAAERQLRVAIRMLFGRKDAIAVHTLAAAARGILMVLGESQGFKSIFEDILLDKEEIETFKKAQNFFKHSARDPNEELVFFPETTMFHLYDAALMHWKLTRRLMPEVTAFLCWYWGKHPHFAGWRAMPPANMSNLINAAKKYAEHDFELILKVLDEYEKPD
jgi:hypothetical protein